MASGTSKSDINVLITKIEKLQKHLKKQSDISLLDIDLQLDYIRNLYDAYLELKYDFTNERCGSVDNLKEDKNSSSASDCGTLSLFGDFEEDNSEIKDVSTHKPIEKEIEVKEELQTKLPQPISVIEKEVLIEPEKEEELPIVEMEVEMDYTTLEIQIEETTSKQSAVIVQELTEDKKLTDNQGDEVEEEESISDINLDDIEFDDDDNEVEIVKKNNITSSIGMSYSRYYGDEIEIENPIPVKPATIGERYKTEKPSLNEIVSSYKPDECIAAKMQQSGISDLMKSIDMNHKFMFVKELFKGNGSVFTEEINKINNFNKLNEAIPYLESIKAKYKWDGQGEAYAELYRLVLRKFAK